MDGNKKKHEEATFPKDAFEGQNGESNKKLSIDVQPASPNSELSQNCKLSVKDTPLQQVQPFFSSTRSPKKALPFNKNSHTQNVSSTQSSQFISRSTYFRNAHQSVAEPPHSSYDHMLSRLRELRAKREQLESYDDLPNFPEVRPIYSFRRPIHSTRRRQNNVVRALNGSQNPPPSYSYSQSNTRENVESSQLTALRLKNGAMQIKYHFTKPVILKVSKDVKNVTCIFPPPSNSRSPPETFSFEVPNPYSNPNVDPEPVNRTLNKNCHQKPTFTPSKKNHRSPITQTRTVDELNSCCIKNQSTSFRKKSLTVPRSNYTGTSYFVPYDTEVPGFYRARLGLRDASTNTESEASLYVNEKSGNVVMEYSDNNTLEKKNSEIVENITKKVFIDNQCTTYEKPLNQEDLVETTGNDISLTLPVEQDTSRSPEDSFDKGVNDMIAYTCNSIEVRDDFIVKKKLVGNNVDDVLDSEFNQESFQKTAYFDKIDKNPEVSVEKELFMFPIPCYNDVEASEFVPHKRISEYEVAAFKVEPSKNINDLFPNIPPVIETEISKASDKSVEVKVNSDIAEKVLDKNNSNPLCSTIDTPLNQKDLAETNSHDTSPQISVELKSIFNTKDASTKDFITCTKSSLFGNTSSFNSDSSKNSFEIGKQINDLKNSDNSILVPTDSEIIERTEKKSINRDALTTLGTSLSQEFKLSSIDPISNTLFKEENYEYCGPNDKADTLLQNYPNANKLEIDHKPKATPIRRSKYKKSFTRDSAESSPIKLKRICTSITKDQKALIMESQHDELEQKNINNHEKSNDHNKILLKTDTLIVADTEKKVISNNLSTPNKNLDFDMIDFIQMDDNLCPPFSTPLNQEFEMAPIALSSNEIIEENIELNAQTKFEAILQKNENISRNTLNICTQKEKFGSPIKTSHQIQYIPLSSDIVTSEAASSFCVPSSTITKQSTTLLNGDEISLNLDSQPELICADTNVISTKCNVVEIEVKTSPKSGKVSQTRLKGSKKPSTFDSCVIDDNSRCSEVNSDGKLPLVMTEEFPESELNVPDSDDSCEKFISSMRKKAATQNTTRKRRRKAKLTVTKRSKKSSVKKESSNSSDIGSIFEDLEIVKFTYRNFKKNVNNLVIALINPEHSLDTVQLIFHLIEYLRCTSKNPMINPDDESFAFHGEVSNLLPIVEDCIVSTLLKIEERRESEFQGLINSTVTTLYNVLLGKEFEFPLFGLVSLCRVLTEICKRQNNKIIPLRLCSELIKWQHQYAPFLIASMASIWQEMFRPSRQSDKEEIIFFGAIALAVKTKPVKLSDSEWQQCQAIFSKVLSVKAVENKQIPGKVCVLMDRIGSKCLTSIYDKDFLLTTPLVIYTQVRGWEWAKEFLIDPFIVRYLKKYYFEVSNDCHAFDFMINLYAEIRFHCPNKEDPYGLLKYYFEAGDNANADAFSGHFATTLALLKLIIWKGDYFSEDIIQWIKKWSNHVKVEAIQPLFQRRLMKNQNFCIADVIEEK